MRDDIDLYAGAERLLKMRVSPIRAVLDKAKAMADAGVDVIPLIAGEPDFNTPEDIKAASIRAIEANYSHYGSNRGLPKLRALIAEDVLAASGIPYSPETEILVTSSGAEAINNAILAFLNPGEQLIVLTPAFVNYENVGYLCGADVVEVPLKLENGFQIDLSAVEAAITPRTRMIAVNNPCNPTGAVYREEALRGLAELAVRHNLLVFSDEIYNRLTYEAAFHSMAGFPGMRERAIVMNGFSKTYAMTGWRLGYLAADERLMKSIVKVHQYSTTCSPTFIQVGLAEAMRAEGTRREVEAMITRFVRRRDLMAEGLSVIPGLRFARPEGAFYAFVDVSGTGLDGARFAARLLEERGVAVVPGGGMGKGCEGFVRLSFATGEDNIARGLARIGEFAAGL